MESLSETPSKTSAPMPSRASFWPAVPPTLLSLMPSVKGLLLPIESLPDEDAFVPANKPGAIQSYCLTQVYHQKAIKQEKHAILALSIFVTYLYY